ncbi:unnamed protein product, partial [Iphiclides podalirius]
MTATKFLTYMDHFIKFTKPTHTKGPELLLLDNHSSQIDINIVAFPPHCTIGYSHWIIMGINGPFKSYCERIDASPSILADRRSGSSTPDLPGDYYLSPNNSPSGQGATTTSSSDPSSMKNIEFTKEPELLVPPPTDPYEAFRLLIDDELLDLIVLETNANAIRVERFNEGRTADIFRIPSSHGNNSIKPFKRLLETTLFV